MLKILFIPLVMAFFWVNGIKPEKAHDVLFQQDRSDFQDPELVASMERGNALYGDFCMRCHLPNGEGAKGKIPPLAGSDWFVNKRTESIQAVKFGLKGAIIVNGVIYDDVMAAAGLSNEEVADVMNYMMNSWGNSQDEMVTPEEVASVSQN